MINPTVIPLGFTVPLSFSAHAAAQQQAQDQVQVQDQSQDQARQTYLKALAVYAVEFYLRGLGLTVSSEQSDWRDPAKRLNVADLWVDPYGKLECCLVLPDAGVLAVSNDARADRIGYLAVQLEPTLKSATLLGFTTAPVTELPLTELESLEQFPAYLKSLSHAQWAEVPQAAVQLRSWLEGGIEAGWQALEILLGGDQLPQAVRHPNHEISVRQAKLIDVGMVLGELSVVLSLAITLNPDTSMNVLTQVFPAAPARHLPPDLKLTMLSETGELLQEVCSREQDNYIQLRHLRGEAGDSFEIRVSLDATSVSESFIL